MTIMTALRTGFQITCGLIIIIVVTLAAAAFTYRMLWIVPDIIRIVISGFSAVIACVASAAYITDKFEM